MSLNGIVKFAAIFLEDKCFQIRVLVIKERFCRHYPMNIRIIRSLLAFGLFFIGGLIYLGYRPMSLQMFTWVDTIGLTPQVIILRNIAYDIQYNWVKYSLPDGLWLFAYMLIIDSIWNGHENISSYLFIFSLPILALLSEFFQYFNLLPGVFDLLDLACYFCSILMYIIMKIF